MQEKGSLPTLITRPMRYEITDNATLTTLDRLHTAAEREFPKIVRRMLRLSLRRVIRPFSRYLRPEDMSDAYIAISREKGRRIYNILRETRARTIIEFGTSFGISTIYLAAAARENGGRVITTELLPEKCAIARRNFAAAGVTEQIELREGDALETLKSMPATIDFLLIDGWYDLYPQLLHLLMPSFKIGTLIYTDNATMPGVRSFVKQLRAQSATFRSSYIKGEMGGAELTEVIA